MNHDRAKGTLRNIFGRIQQHAGHFLGIRELQIKGTRNQAAGNVQRTLGDVADILKAVHDALGKGARAPNSAGYRV